MSPLWDVVATTGMGGGPAAAALAAAVAAFAAVILDHRIYPPMPSTRTTPTHSHSLRRCPRGGSGFPDLAFSVGAGTTGPGAGADGSAAGAWVSRDCSVVGLELSSIKRSPFRKVHKLHLEVRGLPSPRHSRSRSLPAQVFDVSVGAQPRVVGKIPANMVWVFVDHDLIASPVPAGDDVVIVRGDVPVEIVEPEAFPVSSREVENVLRSKAAVETSVSPRLIEAEMRVVAATIVAYPSAVPGIHVRNVRMALPVHPHVILGRGPGLLTAGRGGRARRRDRKSTR